MLQHTKRQVKLLGMICSAMFIIALCYFSYQTSKAKEQESLW